MGAGIFWGVILIIIGLSIILRIFLDVNVFRIVIASVFILIGIKMLIGRQVFHYHGDDRHVAFGERIINSAPEDGTEYSTVFGKTVYDFRNATNFPTGETKISVNTVFGETDILLPKDVEVQVKADAAFANAMMPNGNTISFGSTMYDSDVSDTGNFPRVKINASVVFGNLKIKQ